MSDEKGVEMDKTIQADDQMDHGEIDSQTQPSGDTPAIDDGIVVDSPVGDEIEGPSSVFAFDMGVETSVEDIVKTRYLDKDPDTDEPVEAPLDTPATWRGMSKCSNIYDGDGKITTDEIVDSPIAEDVADTSYPSTGDCTLEALHVAEGIAGDIIVPDDEAPDQAEIEKAAKEYLKRLNTLAESKGDTLSIKHVVTDVNKNMYVGGIEAELGVVVIKRTNNPDDQGFIVGFKSITDIKSLSIANVSGIENIVVIGSDDDGRIIAIVMNDSLDVIFSTIIQDHPFEILGITRFNDQFLIGTAALDTNEFGVERHVPAIMICDDKFIQKSILIVNHVEKTELGLSDDATTIITELITVGDKLIAGFIVAEGDRSISMISVFDKEFQHIRSKSIVVQNSLATKIAAINPTKSGLTIMGIFTNNGTDRFNFIKHLDLDLNEIPATTPVQ